MNSPINHSDLIRRIIDLMHADMELSNLFEDYTKTQFADKKVCYNDQTANMAFNSFLYEYRIQNKSVLAYLIKNHKSEFPSEESDYLNRIDNNIYGLFEVLSVKIGESLRLRDVQTEKTYDVSERAGSFNLSAGDIVFCRIADRGDAWIILYNDGKYLLEDAYLIKRNFKDMKIPLSTPLIAEMFHKEKDLDEDGREVNPEKHLKRLIKKYIGKKIKLKGIKKMFLENPENSGEIIKKFLKEQEGKLSAHERELMENSMLEYTNFLFDKETKAGMIEKIITKQLFIEVQKHFAGRYEHDNPPSKKEIDEFTREWINKAQSELGGRTPKDVVESEHKSRGNIDPYAPDIVINMTKMEDKSREKNKKALDFMKKDNPEKALPIFLELAEKDLIVHEALFFNIGACYYSFYFLHKPHDINHIEKAIQWFKRTLEINPEHPKANKYLQKCGQIKLFSRGKTTISQMAF